MKYFFTVWTDDVHISLKEIKSYADLDRGTFVDHWVLIKDGSNEEILLISNLYILQTKMCEELIGSYLNFLGFNNDATELIDFGTKRKKVEQEINSITNSRKKLEKSLVSIDKSTLKKIDDKIVFLQKEVVSLRQKVRDILSKNSIIITGIFTQAGLIIDMLYPDIKVSFNDLRDLLPRN